MLPIDGSGHPIPKPPMLSHHDQTCIMLDLEWGGVDTVLQNFAKLHMYMPVRFMKEMVPQECVCICAHKNVIYIYNMSLSLCIWYMNSNLSERFTYSSERIFFLFEWFTNKSKWILFVRMNFICSNDLLIRYLFIWKSRRFSTTTIFSLKFW